jgi:hypothetical protein
MAKQEIPIPVIDGIFKVVNSLNLGELFKGKEKKLQEFQLALAKEMHKANELQVSVNKIEASHKNIFVSGWRPFVGWICGFALLYGFIIQPILYTILSAYQVETAPPILDIAQLITVLLAMLGMSGYRTYEKIQDKKIITKLKNDNK